MQKTLVILEKDAHYALQRIAELEKAIQDLGPAFNNVFNQSSETWHDNAPFDALRDHQSVLNAELQQLRQIMKNRVLKLPPVKKGVVGIGSRVTLSDDKRYLIAGDWTPRAGQVDDGWIVISAQAPLALALRGKRMGDVVPIGRRTLSIVSVI